MWTKNKQVCIISLLDRLSRIPGFFQKAKECSDSYYAILKMMICRRAELFPAQTTSIASDYMSPWTARRINGHQPADK